MAIATDQRGEGTVRRWRWSGFLALMAIAISLVLLVETVMIGGITPAIAQSPPQGSPAVAPSASTQADADQQFQQGLQHYRSGALEEAIAPLTSALNAYQTLHSQAREVVARQALGAVYLALEQHEAAIAQFEAALTLARQQDDRTAQAGILSNLGIAYRAIGHYSQAIAAQEQALAIARAMSNAAGNTAAEGQILANLGNAYESVGDYDNAIAVYNQSLAIARANSDRGSEAVALGNIGAIQATQGHYTEAIASYQQSLAIAQAINNQAGQAYTLQNIGAAYHAQGDYTTAIDYYQRSLPLTQAVGDRALEGDTLSNLGSAYEDIGDYPQAIAYHQQSLAIAQALSDPRAEGNALNNLGHAFFEAGQLEEAETQLRRAVTRLESLRPGLDDAYNVSVFDTQVLTYNLLQQILVAQDQVEAALEISERGRARAFVDLLARRAVEPTRADRSSRQAAVTDSPTIRQIRRIARDQQATLVEYAIVPDGTFKVQGKQRGREAELFIWVVQPSGAIAFRRVDLRPLWEQGQVDSLADLVVSGRFSIGVRGGEEAIQRGEESTTFNWRKLQQLYSVLIAPIAELLPTDPDAAVIFIPQESLFLVPFPALQAENGDFLLAQHTILTAPAIQVLDLTRQQQQRQERQKPRRSPTATLFTADDMLLVGNPTMPVLALREGRPPAPLSPLPGAEQEAIAISQLLDVPALIGDRATEATVLDRINRAKIIHLATHGLLQYGQADQPGQRHTLPGAIALAPSGSYDGLLTSDEILDLRLNANLVVLSACNTGRGQITGDGVIGLSRSFISAGAASIVVSLWSVSDESTALIMTRFYEQLQTGATKAQALRQAMLAGKEAYSHPVEWSAFTLIGEAE
ncbi:MAG TPA: CHAT domain-containing protein [Chroococcidiopsis sp.]